MSLTLGFWGGCIPCSLSKNIELINVSVLFVVNGFVGCKKRHTVFVFDLVEVISSRSKT